ncbi:NADP-dependent oxidoreductase [Nakamurella leprariae]|uniref:NADP-dependent oxidoreductase n=1 Tax=Nakamurella leprariae TaxID=2803911 RepID=A0A938YAA6_9ACTN|nr:NADP-dependent oxidoreductase [Nakamurella leprariae]MBM9465943.1 NADP-dependent oxidoreductase [Nakamurella leprariae]
MRAVLMSGYGGTEVLQVAEVPDPIAGAGEVVVDIHAASVNAADAKVRAGVTVYDDMSFPHILGRDFSGVVSTVGDGADLRPGDEVFGVCLRGTDGGYAERIVIPAAIVARKPTGIDHTGAAALALAGVTAIYGLEDAGELHRGQHVLIQGGAGGVAGFAIQLAKFLGAEVTTTCSANNADYVTQLGADHVIDYHRTDFTTLGARFDLVYDTVGGEVQRRSATVVRPGGRLVYCAPGPEGRSPSRDDIGVIHPEVRRDRAHLDRVTELVTTGAVRLPTITSFPLDQVADAHRLSESRHLQGKLVLRMR